jgi:hypothetical protein
MRLNEIAFSGDQLLITEADAVSETSVVNYTLTLLIAREYFNANCAVSCLRDMMKCNASYILCLCDVCVNYVYS